MALSDVSRCPVEPDQTEPESLRSHPAKLIRAFLSLVSVKVQKLVLICLETLLENLYEICIIQGQSRELRNLLNQAHLDLTFNSLFLREAPLPKVHLGRRFPCLFAPDYIGGLGDDRDCVVAEVTLPLEYSGCVAHHLRELLEHVFFLDEVSSCLFFGLKHIIVSFPLLLLFSFGFLWQCRLYFL